MNRRKSYRIYEYTISNTVVKLIENYVLWNKKSDLVKLDKIAKTIPSEFTRQKKGLYRGMTLPIDDYNKIMQGGSITLNDYSSWTTDFAMALRFITDDKKRVGGRGKTKTETVNVVLQYNPTRKNILVNVYDVFKYLNDNFLTYIYEIDELNLEMALEEFETILRPKVKISKKHIINV